MNSIQPSLDLSPRPKLRLSEIERILRKHRIIVPIPSRRFLIRLCEDGTLETARRTSSKTWLVFEDSFLSWVKRLDEGSQRRIGFKFPNDRGLLYTLMGDGQASHKGSILKTNLKNHNLSAEGLKFAIVVSRWNDTITEKLALGAFQALKESGAVNENIHRFDVPGAFELPLACYRAARRCKFDAVIALGVVIRGETPHFEYVAGQAAAGIMRASMKTDVPVMFGVITADTLDQALARAGEKADNKGYEAAMSAIEMVHALREMEESFQPYF